MIDQNTLNLEIKDAAKEFRVALNSFKAAERDLDRASARFEGLKLYADVCGYVVVEYASGDISVRPTATEEQ